MRKLPHLYLKAKFYAIASMTEGTENPPRTEMSMTHAIRVAPRALPRLPRRYAPVAFAFLMSGLLTSLMSGFVTFINTGFDAGFGAHWLTAYGLAWSLAFPLVTLLAPRVRRVVGRITA